MKNKKSYKQCSTWNMMKIKKENIVKKYVIIKYATSRVIIYRSESRCKIKNINN